MSGSPDALKILKERERQSKEALAAVPASQHFDDTATIDEAIQLNETSGSSKAGAFNAFY